MDAANVDLKAFTESFYRRLCAHLDAGAGHLLYVKQETETWLRL